MNTYLIKFFNKSLVTKKDLIGGRRRNSEEVINVNQLNRIVVQVENSSDMKGISEVINKILFRRHNEVEDYKIIIPELLLEQEKETKRIFNIVLGAIASISLLVGGIGIMNIMLASVMERTKEIGVRKAVGAKRRDILLQFLIEAMMLSFTGGIVGIIAGFGGTYLIELLTGISTIIELSAVLLSFIVSISVGLIFGIAPARKASLQDPIDLLRYE
jgi:putative ABC transport system permease protein